MPSEWREHPKLKGRFHPDHVDDLQVIVHDGGPRITRRSPEAVWVNVTGIDGGIFRGRVLNQPQNLQTVRQGSEIKFVMPDGADHPVMVTEKYLVERAEWVIHPCNRCGLAELFDAPSDLMRAAFPGLPPDGKMKMFTAFCPLCGGVQGVEFKDDSTGSEDDRQVSTSKASKRPWWKFWS